MKINGFKTTVLVLSILCAFLAAPVPASAVDPMLGILIYNYGDTYVTTVRIAIARAAVDKAFIKMQDAVNNQVAQLDQIDAMLANRVNGLAVNIVEVTAAESVMEKAKGADIPIVFFNREPDIETVKSYNKAVFVGTNAADAGRMQGDIIKHLWENHPEYDLNKDGKCQYILLMGDPENLEAIARSEWSVKQAENNGVSMEQIGKPLVCKWDMLQAYHAMETAIIANEGRVELVISNNDAMALGAVNAMSYYGYNREGGDKYIPVIGVDATDQAIDAISRGVMSATVKQDGEAMGKAVASILLNMVSGKSPLEGTNYRFDGSGAAVRIPYFAIYMNK
jgi:methyl-galactoside transport system substrate-binding protein